MTNTLTYLDWLNWIERLNIVETGIFSKLLYRFYRIPIKIPGGCFEEIDWP